MRVGGKIMATIITLSLFVTVSALVFMIASGCVILKIFENNNKN